MAIKYQIKHLGKIAIGISCLTLFGITVLLFFEYRFFHDQAQKMLELKEEYRAYTQAVKKIINEYNAMKEEAQEESNQPEMTTKDSFLLVNREPNYLRKAFIDHVRKENLEFILKSIDPNEWTDYGDQLIKKTATPIATKKRRRRRKISKIQNFPAHQTYLTGPKDITFIWPIDRSQFWISSFFGPRKKPDNSWGFHYGIDMAACRGIPIKAANAGMVIEAHYHAGYGNTVLIMHNNKYKTRYAHLDKIMVYVGQKVDQGTVIGKVGSTGAVRAKKGRDPSHLHFEVYAHGKQVNPLSFFI